MSRNDLQSAQTLAGIGVSPGIVIGKARVVEKTRVKILYQYLIRDEQLAAEVARFEEALRVTEQQLESLRERIPEGLKDHVFIMDSLLLILGDSMLTDATVKRIREEKINAEWALKRSLEDIRRLFAQIEDPYISNRIQDVEDVADRILHNLAGQAPGDLSGIDERAIIVAPDLTLTNTVALNGSKVMGFITDVGGRTSHAAIMAQAMQIPVVVGLEHATRVIRDGDLLIVDGSTGKVIVRPDTETLARYRQKQVEYEAYTSDIARTSHLPAQTLDGHHVAVRANIEFLEEVVAAKDHGAEGIGLYRTEFLYLRQAGLPAEEALFEDYRQVVELMSPEPVTIRTLDLGSDKVMPEMTGASETNPAMGLRAIRLSLRNPKLFRTQLRAILRASNYGRVKVLLPMITGVQEVLDAKAIFAQVQDELAREGIAFDERIPLGIMVEVPSAVVMADSLARHVDFFSIGTNDLIQYALAVDRINEHVAYMYEPYHPAILRMIHQVVSAANRAGISVGLCGEMAGDPLCLPILLGMGVHELSMNPRAVPLIKKIIQSISLEDIRAGFETLLALPTAREVRERVQAKMRSVVPELEEKGYLAL